MKVRENLFSTRVVSDWRVGTIVSHFVSFDCAFFKTDLGQRIPCMYTTPRLGCPETVRAHPFYTEEPTEEEKEAMAKAREELREGNNGNSSDNPVAQELLKAAKALEGKLDFSSNAGKKQAVGEFVSLVVGKVDLPQNRNPKMEIGKLVVANASKSAEEIMQIIFDKYGFVEAKEEKAAAKEAAAETACANPKNAGLILAFAECAKVRYLLDMKLYNKLLSICDHFPIYLSRETHDDFLLSFSNISIILQRKIPMLPCRTRRLTKLLLHSKRRLPKTMLFLSPREKQSYPASAQALPRRCWSFAKLVRLQNLKKSDKLTLRHHWQYLIFRQHFRNTTVFENPTSLSFTHSTRFVYTNLRRDSKQGS